MDIPRELWGNPAVQGLLLNVAASACYDILKGVGRQMFKGSQTDFDESVDETIAYFMREEGEKLEIPREYFRKLFEEPDVYSEVVQFESGLRDVSVTNIAQGLIKVGFYHPTHQLEKAEGIVRVFLSNVIHRALEDPVKGRILLFGTMQLIQKQNTEFGKVTIEAIQLLQSTIELKLDEIYSSNQQLVGDMQAVRQELRSINKALEAPAKGDGDDQPPELQVAVKMHNEGNLKAARRLYVDLLRKKPTNIDLLWKLNGNIGKTYLNAEDAEKGIPYFEQAYHYFPTEEKGKIQLAFARLIAGRSDEGLLLANEILAQNPASVDAVVVAANLLVRQGGRENVQQAKNLFTAEILANPQSFYTYAWVLRNQDAFEEAERYYRKSLESERRPECLVELAVCILEPITRSLRLRNPAYTPTEGRTQARLEEALALFNEAIVGFKDQDAVDLPYAYLNRSVVHANLNRFDEAYHDCLEAEKLGLEVETLFRNKGVALAMLDKPDLAAQEFEKAVNRGDQVSITYLLRSLMQSNQVAKARRVALLYVSYPDIKLTHYNLDYYLVLSEILERELDSEGANAILALAREQFPGAGEVVVRLANIIRSRHGIQPAIRVLTEALPSLTERAQVVELTLADMYFQSEMWEQSLEIYNNYIRNDSFELPVQRRLICLHNLGRHASCLQEITSLRSKYGNERLLRELEARIQFFSEDFAAASPLYKDLAMSFKSPHDYVQWGKSEFRLAHLQEAQRILSVASKEFRDNPADLIAISAAFNVIGETEKAVDLAYGAAVSLPESSEAVLNFFWIFNQHTQQNPGDDHAREEFIRLYQDISEHFEERFPGVPGLKKVPFPKAEGEMTADDFAQSFRREMPPDEYVRSREQLFLSHRLPISTFAKMIGRDMIETWSELVWNQHYRVWAYNPLRFPKERGKMRSKDIIAEPIALLTLYKLGQLNLLERLFEKILVPQRFLDTVQMAITCARASAVTGSMVIVPTKDSFHLVRKSPEEIGKYLEWLKELREFLIGRTVGYPVVDQQVERERQQIFLREETVQAIEQAIALNIPLLSDEAILPDIFSDSRLATISTHTIIEYARVRNFLQPAEFNRAMSDLCNANYHFIPVGADILLQGLQEAGFEETPRSVAAFRSIGDPDSDPVSDAKVIAEFILGMFEAPISELSKGYWVDYALNHMPQVRVDPAVLLRIVMSHLNEKLRVSLIVKAQIMRWVKSRLKGWADSRGIAFS